MNIQTMFLNNSKKTSIAVVGDICLDLYYFVTGDRAEISAETRMPTKSVYKFKHEAGGAGNVAINCKYVNASTVDLYGVVGDDYYGKIVRDILAREKIGTEGIFVQKADWDTHVYHKIFENNEESVRYDAGNFNVPSQALCDQLLELLEKKLHTYDCIIINEQVPQGLHSDYFRTRFNRLIEKYSDALIWFADCRKLNDFYKRTIHKLNVVEGRAIFGAEEGGGELSDTGLVQWLGKRWLRPVVLTRGADGALVYDMKNVHNIDGLHFIKRIDIVGAGDAFLSAMAVACAAGIPLDTAAEIGNFAAGVSVQKLFETGHPSLAEVQQIASDPDYRYHPDVAADSRLAKFIPETEIEVIGAYAPETTRQGYPRIAIFDHDGTISTLRQGWETVMESVMIRCITGEQYGKLGPVQLERIRVRVGELIEKTTGIQTIVQMKELVGLIHEYAYIPDEKILSPSEYKALYTGELHKKMEQKLKWLRVNRLTVDDLTIKGAVGFLKDLYDHGTTLYLASGTDQEEVKEEADLLGYGVLFGDRIYGSVGDIENDPKRLVIKKIIKDIGLDGNEKTSRQKSCVVFGDGPVEMREARKHDLCAIGILSDEVQRFGRNVRKRERLILGGADILLPDFSWTSELADFLKWR